MATKISISFKETTKDQKLYDKIMKFEKNERSEEVKRLLYDILVNNQEYPKQVNAKSENINIMNF